MKKIFILSMTALMFISCSCGGSEPKVIDSDDKTFSLKPTDNYSGAKPLEVLGVYDVTGGNLYVYKFGSDTIYWAEGRSSSYPVALQVK